MENNAQYSFASPRRQLLSFPPDMIASMLKNPSSSKGLMKLYQTCKYFYGKRPILAADDVAICSCYDCFGTQRFHICVKGRDCSRIQTPVWVAEELELYGTFHQPQRLPPRFRYSCTDFYLGLHGLQYEDFVLVTSENTITNFKINQVKANVAIVHADMSKATLVEILQQLRNVQYFIYFIDEECSIGVLKKLLGIKMKNKLRSFVLEIKDVHASFDLNVFCEFVMKNSDSETFLCFPEAQQKLKPLLDKLDDKWKKEAHRYLKEFFVEIDKKWN